MDRKLDPKNLLPIREVDQSKALTGTDNYREVLEPSTARTLATFENTLAKSPAITVNRFGKGRAIYLATATQAFGIGF